ncbi:phosphonate metabolism protein/1,5-bisphosphokinase (PRPP-forming) PhnN [Rhizobium paknamense]|uniref:Ribose 1,5-bisphosphate phosphokinase PhnN n=1 Tax=Rhizobium paknamense TaxID=1206817 RepID=A0ABU0IAW5_9HYPH|nr:phosphonate metabolism protein/1,5-bisphosphokinase (PRPP-forming) PhnN [Rhizobium paknamense]MDQ0455374.1 ribose 1,5-bisphosphokinase [Rhizobium paknamense]
MSLIPAGTSRQPQAATGCLIAVVGPSGAGKDSLIDFARRHFAGQDGVHFARRIITRDAQAGGEDHQPATPEEFEAWRATGRFAVDWQAHGLCYGIPADVCGLLGQGQVVIANGSRSVLPRFADAFGCLLVVNVTARPEVLADRLEARGRESREDILARLARSSLAIRGDYHVVEIDNSGLLEEAGRKFVAVIEDQLLR